MCVLDEVNGLRLVNSLDAFTRCVPCDSTRLSTRPRDIHCSIGIFRREQLVSQLPCMKIQRSFVDQAESS